MTKKRFALTSHLTSERAFQRFLTERTWPHWIYRYGWVYSRLGEHYLVVHRTHGAVGLACYALFVSKLNVTPSGRWTMVSVLSGPEGIALSRLDEGVTDYVRRISPSVPQLVMEALL